MCSRSRNPGVSSTYNITKYSTLQEDFRPSHPTNDLRMFYQFQQKKQQDNFIYGFFKRIICNVLFAGNIQLLLGVSSIRF